MNARRYTTLVHVTSISLLSGTVRSALSMRPRCAKIRHGGSPGTPSSLDDATRGAKKTYAHAPWRAEPATQLFFGSVVIIHPWRKENCSGWWPFVHEGDTIIGTTSPEAEGSANVNFWPCCADQGCHGIGNMNMTSTRTIWNTPT
ncbi:hypothetical protein V8E55_008900 [Tylopilus felleus]